MKNMTHDDEPDLLTGEGIGLIDADFDAWHDTDLDLVAAFLDPEEP